MSYKEISDTCDISEGVLRVRIHKIKNKINQSITMWNKHIKNNILILLILSLFCFHSCNSGDRINDFSTVINQMNSLAIPLPNNEALTYSDEIFNKIKWPEKLQIVALGEAVHGSSTLFNAKSRIFRYLVENKGFRVLCYEFSFEKSLEIDRYITSGEGDIDSLMRSQYWIQANYDILELMKWMRSYNVDREEDDKIHFIGLDNQVDMLNPERFANAIKKRNENLYNVLKVQLQSLLKLDEMNYRGMEEMSYLKISELINEIYLKSKVYLLNSEKSQISLEDKMTFHLIESLRGSHEFLYKFLQKGVNTRDLFLAKNTLWATGLFENKGIALWAHNAHVCSDKYNYPNIGFPMGKYLKDSLSSDYLIIGTGFTGGEFIAVEVDTSGHDTPPHVITIDTIPPRSSVNSLFNQTKYDDFIIDLRNIKTESTLFDYLNTDRGFLGVGDCYIGNTLPHYQNDRIVNILKGYDIIFYFLDVDPIILLNK